MNVRCTMPSIKDVAKKAGVGIATVSRVINGSGYVKAETKLKIESIIKEMGYRPNEIARSMTQQKNHIVAFIVPNTTHMFFGELVYEVEKKLYEKNYKLMLCTSTEELEKEIIYIDMLSTNRVDAIILLTNNDIEKYLNVKHNIVSVDRRFQHIPFVASNNYRGGELAALHLMERGATRFMFIGDDQQGEHTIVNTEVSLRRFAFKETLKKHGYEEVVDIEYPLGNYIDIPSSVEEELLKHPEVNGIFCISDAVAAFVIKALLNQGRNIPKDVKVVGYDSGRSFLNLGLEMTSIDQQPNLLAEALVNTIEQFYQQKETSNTITPVRLKIGQTT
jgi:DNA-binding LacI/PurR family transcriptional regulator